MVYPESGFKGLLKLTALLLATSLLAGCGKNSNQDGLASLAFNYLKNNDFEGYSRYIMTHSDAMSLLNTLERSRQFTAYPVKKKTHFHKIKKRLDKKVKKQVLALEKNFNSVFDQGVRKGVTWSRTKFVKTKIGIPESVFELEGLQQQNIFIIFKHKKKEYTLRLRNNIKVNRGWVIVDGFRWEK